MKNLNLAIRFAVLVHHLPDTNLRTLCERVRVPADCRDLAIMVARWHAEAHHARELDAEKLLSLLDGTDALRRPERFYEFLDACRCIPGAEAHENRFLITALTQLQSMNQRAIAATVTATGIAKAIRAAKLAVLDHHILDYSTSERKS